MYQRSLCVTVNKRATLSYGSWRTNVKWPNVPGDNVKFLLYLLKLPDVIVVLVSNMVLYVRAAVSKQKLSRQQRFVLSCLFSFFPLYVRASGQSSNFFSHATFFRRWPDEMALYVFCFDSMVSPDRTLWDLTNRFKNILFVTTSHHKVWPFIASLR